MRWHFWRPFPTVSPRHRRELAHIAQQATTAIGLALLLTLGLVVILRAGTASAALAPAASPPDAPPTKNALRLVADDAGLTLDLLTGDYTLAPVALDGAPFLRLTAPEMTPLGEPGAPELPVRHLLLAAPPGASVRVVVLTAESEDLPLAGPLAPAAAAAPLPSLAETGASPDVRPAVISYTYALDAGWMQQNAWLPADLAQIGGDGILRDQRVVRLSLHPFQYNPRQGSLRIVHRLRVRVDFDRSPASAPQGAPPSAISPFEDVLRANLANYQQGLAWRLAPEDAPLAARPAAARTLQAPVTGERWRIEVAQDGLTALDHSTLQSAGVPLDSIDPRNLHLWRAQQEIAILIEGEADGHFDLDDRLLFFGQQMNTRYTDVNVYWLTHDAIPGLRMATRAVAPVAGVPPPAFWRIQRLEENHFYLSDLPREEGADHWYWTSWSVGRRGEMPTHTVTVTLPGLLPDVSGLLTATLRASVYGQSTDYFINPDHHLRFLVNGVAIAHAYFDGLVVFDRTFVYNQNLLQTGANVFQLNSVLDTGMAQESGYVQWYEIGYWQAARALNDWFQFDGAQPLYRVQDFSGQNLLLLDITDPTVPVRLTDFALEAAGGLFDLRFSDSGRTGRYLAQNSALAAAPLAVSADAPSNLSDTSNRADMLIISHANFLDSLAPLVALRQSQGLQVALIDVQDVYDEFSGGVFDAEALRDFLAYAFYNWQAPAPRFVLLVGDGHYDFKNYFGTNTPNFIPPYLKMVDPYLGETATDNRLVTVAGDDVLPDMAIGRLPVNTYDEINALVSKIVTYETAPPEGDWRLRHLFISDNPDSAGNFWELSNAIADTHVVAPYVTSKIYYGQPPYTSPLVARQAIVNAYNQGALIVSYVGHSSIPWWAAEILFSTTQVPLLNNDQRTPIMLPMTCYDGYFQDPRFASLGETVVRVNGRGAVASWSATGLGVAHGHDYLERGFYTSVFGGGDPNLGQATIAGKVLLYVNDPRFLDLMDTYLLLGDPAMNTLLIDTDLQVSDQLAPAVPVAQGEWISYTLAYTNAGPAIAVNALFTLELPTGLLDVAIQSSAPMTAVPNQPNVWQLGSVPANAAGAISVSARLDPALTLASLPLRIGGRLSTSWRERTLTNNGQTYTISVAPADLAVTLATAPAGIIQPGDEVTFIIGYSNQGAGVAAGGVLTFPAPAGLLDPVVSFSGPALTPAPGAPFGWHLSDLVSGAGGQISVTGRVDPNLTPGQSLLVGVASAHTTWLDSDAGNDQASASLLVNVLDAYEPDDQLLQASPLLAPGIQSNHTCHRLGDVDWIRFDARAGVVYYLRTFNLTGNGDTIMSLHDSLGTELAKNDDYLPGSRWSGIDWTAPATRKYFIRITGAGEPWCGFRYDLSVTTSLTAYLPAVGRSIRLTGLVSQP